MTVTVASALHTAYRPGSYGHAAEPAVAYAEVTGWDLVQVDAWTDTWVQVKAALHATLGVAVPEQANHAATGHHHAIFTLAPFRIWCLASSTSNSMSRLAELPVDLGSVTPLGHSRTRIRITGTSAREILLKAVPIDVHPDEFQTGRLAQTVLNRVPVLLHCVDDHQPMFELFVPRTFALSGWEYLCDLTAGTGLRIMPRVSHAG